MEWDFKCAKMESNKMHFTKMHFTCAEALKLSLLGSTYHSSCIQSSGPHNVSIGWDHMTV